MPIVKNLLGAAFLLRHLCEGGVECECTGKLSVRQILHVLAADGAFLPDGRFVALPPVPGGLLAEGFRRAVLDFLFADLPLPYHPIWTPPAAQEVKARGRPRPE